MHSKTQIHSRRGACRTEHDVHFGALSQNLYGHEGLTCELNNANNNHIRNPYKEEHFQWHRSSPDCSRDQKHNNEENGARKARHAQRSAPTPSKRSAVASNFLDEENPVPQLENGATNATSETAPMNAPYSRTPKARAMRRK